MWLECIGVVSGCCCKEVYRFPHNYYLSLLYFYYNSSFCSSIPTPLFLIIVIVNVIFVLYICSKHCQIVGSELAILNIGTTLVKCIIYYSVVSIII